MKIKHEILTLLAGVVFLAGCIAMPHLPVAASLSPRASQQAPKLPDASAPAPAHALTPVEVAAVADVQAGLPEPALTKKEAAAVSAVVGAPVAASPAPAEKPTARSEIQKTVNWFCALLIIAAVAGIGFGAFSIYIGHYVSGVQFIAGGIGLAMFGIWFAFHWLLVLSLSLIGAAVFYLCTHYALIKPILDRLDAQAERAAAWVEQEAKKI
jgi:hypothetical protein